MPFSQRYASAASRRRVQREFALWLRLIMIEESEQNDDRNRHA